MNEPELPDEFLIQEAENGDRVTAKDGETEFIVVVDEYSGERQTVRADAVDWDTWHEHPALQAAAAMGAIAGLFVGLLYGGGITAELLAEAYVNTEAEVWRLTYGWGLIIGIAVVYTMLLVFRQTRAQWWLYRWERYADVRRDLKRARESDR